jgi:hypothetical protein
MALRLPGLQTKRQQMTKDEAQAKQDAYREYRRQYAIAFGKPYQQDGGERRVGDAASRPSQSKDGSNF